MYNKKLFLVLVGILTAWTSCQTTKPREVAEAPNQQPNDAQYFDKLSKYSPYKYEVLFTDPECGVYKYTKTVKSIGGKVLTQKPEDVYCKNRYDLVRSGSRPQSPQYRLIEWINDPNTKEIFFTYLSFSNKAVKNALCEAAQKRNVKIHFVMGKDDTSRAQELVACKPENIEMKTRGMEGDLGYAHNKFFIVNPSSKTEFKIVFSSGNMSSGPVMHHENWNFITTSPNSHFAQSHLCAMNAEWNDKTGTSRLAYINSIKSCRSQIQAPEEKDIKVFFVPGEGEPEVGVNDGKKTAVDYMKNGDGEFPGIRNSSRIWMACHRFFYGKMIYALKARAQSFKAKPDMRIVCDDDTYYKANDPQYDIGDTLPAEWTNMQDLKTLGAKIKFMETNGEEHQLHHSKYLIFASGDEVNNKVKATEDEDKQAVRNFKAVFTGSANLTGAGFNKNWENSYYITIPEVVKSFATHYVKTWHRLASNIEDLPTEGKVSGYLTDAPDKEGEQDDDPAPKNPGE